MSTDGIDDDAAMTELDRRRLHTVATGAGRVDELVARLAERGETVAAAESLTGGLLTATLVTVPGVSRVLRGGLVVYATDLKHALAGVDESLLAERGPVDADVAVALARGARERCGADWGLSTTGVAGPGPQDGIPAGTVFVGLAGPGGSTDVVELSVRGDRAAVRATSVDAALDLLWRATA
ncbi:CinA family protein [Catellatospora sp. KI3]|uniref:CinA family protein n=1 Tax=Catellatospora sp. KI3 TaxID=3041620 RepID=UPI0024822429|nr:CinA family protein [Catellatospora sp. KI3]MDI1459393.1 CinA family protein [Catellatospora sp. KI3]